MIIELLKKCFGDNGFEIKKFDIYKGFAWKTFLAMRPEANKKKEFFIIIDKENGKSDDLNSLLDVEIPNIFDAAKSQPFYQGEFDRNATLLICFNGEAGHPSVIWKIEEDPYYFKKNVLCYSEEQLEELEHLINNDFSTGNLNKLLYDPDKFKNMKEKNAEPGYALLIQLFVKLPFLKYSVSNKADFTDLSGTIKEELKKKNLYDLCQAVNVTNWDSTDACEEFLEMLKSTPGGDDV